MKKQLMLVDDSLMVKLQISKMLENTDFEIVAYCANGEEAIAKYEEILPDVVTLDLITPGIDGLETAQVILDKHPDAKLIIISSLSDEKTINAIESTGISTYISKPFARDGLINILNKLFE